jgi:hypothetical protein
VSVTGLLRVTRVEEKSNAARVDECIMRAAICRVYTKAGAGKYVQRRDIPGAHS